MNERIDIEAIYRQERTRWFREEAPRKSIREMIADSVPYWIVLVALVLFGLSAPHTAGMFDKLTPGWGWISPVGVEFGLLYCSFQRRLAKAANIGLPISVLALEILLFITAMLVNGTGAFVSVVVATGIDNLSFAGIVEHFGTFPATSQAALIMAVLSAFIIPIGALVAGEGLAALALERKTGYDHRERAWQEVEFTVIYRAVFVRYLQQGIVEREARNKALSEVKGYLGRASSFAVRTVSAPSGQNGHSANGHLGSVKERVRSYITEHPELQQLSVNQLLSVLQEAGVQAGRTTVAEVLQEWRHLEDKPA